MFPILLSCLVSLITIFILFFQVQNINPRKIPSWYFGKENKKTIKNKILINKPPLIPLVLIILDTIAFAISYYTQKEAKGILPLNKSALIWIDPSLQAKLSRENSNFNPQREADKITDLEKRTFEKLDEHSERLMLLFRAIKELARRKDEPRNPIGFKISTK